ncbi:hypothetical protein ISCGN_013653 [Ixodes scapularis]
MHDLICSCLGLHGDDSAISSSRITPSECHHGLRDPEARARRLLRPSHSSRSPAEECNCANSVARRDAALSAQTLQRGKPSASQVRARPRATGSGFTATFMKGPGRVPGLALKDSCYGISVLSLDMSESRDFIMPCDTAISLDIVLSRDVYKITPHLFNQCL